MGAGSRETKKGSTMSDCLFCKFVSHEIKTDVVYEDDNVFAFKDINPQAPVHVLVVTKKHIATLNDLTVEDVPEMGQLILSANKIAKEMGLSERGYRLILNCNKDAGQTVFHIHCHLLGGRTMGWPPG